jgi:DNA polymerase-3 subunit alpha
LSAQDIQQIIENRPYLNFRDFLETTSCNKTAIINLIKAGAFDQFGERMDIMKEYITMISEPKKRLTMQNFSALCERDLLPNELIFQKRVYVFNKALKQVKKGEYFLIKNNYYDFYQEFFDLDLLEPLDQDLAIDCKVWKREYDNVMLTAKNYITKHNAEMLRALNDKLFEEIWNKYAAGNYSSWEMESLGFYYHDHELKNIDKKLYNIKEYNSLPETPEVEFNMKRAGKMIPIFKTCRICGTVIAKDDVKSIVTILTPESGVVNVKFTKEYYANYNRRLSETQIDGSKKVMEQGWFIRGSLIVVNGFRREICLLLKHMQRPTLINYI